MAAHYLDFERPIADLESKIEELSRLSETAGPGAFETEIQALRDRAQQLRKEAYAGLDAWQKTMVARHPERPHLKDYLAGLIDDFVELRGDRKFADDQAIVGGLGRFRGAPVLVMGHEKGHATETGEGGSGGAIALAAANRVLILEHSIYSVISPEGCASILWRDGARARDAAQAMKITAQDLKG